MNSLRERDIEKKLAEAVRKSGGLAPKFVSPGLDGMPDRIILFPKGRVAFVEVKAPGKKPRPLQIRRIKQLQSLGFRVYVIDEPEQIERVIKTIQTGGDAE